MIIQKSYKVRLYPNNNQEQELLRILTGCRWVWNHFLAKKQDFYFKNKGTLRYNDMSKELPNLRRTQPELVDVPSMPLQQSLRRLDVAYSRFFKNISNIPRAKSDYDTKQSFQKPKDWQIVSKNKIQIARGMVVGVRGRLPSGNKPKLRTITVSYVARSKWYASILVEEEIEIPKKHTDPIGIDLGLISLATTNNGDKYKVEKHPLSNLVARFQKKLSKQEIGSKRRDLTLLQLARLHHKIANIRKDNLQKVTTTILKGNPSLVALEDLSITNMLKNHRLARSISDASWGEFARQIKYKIEWKGGKVVEINRFFPSSKTCSKCFYKKEDMKLSDREWSCSNCGAHHDRDVNAAKMILAEGLGRGTPHVEVVIG